MKSKTWKPKKSKQKTETTSPKNTREKIMKNKAPQRKHRKQGNKHKTTTIIKKHK